MVLTGRVEDSDGAPIEAASVSVHARVEGDWSRLAAVGSSDAEGRFEFERVPLGPVQGHGGEAGLPGRARARSRRGRRRSSHARDAPGGQGHRRRRGRVGTGGSERLGSRHGDAARDPRELGPESTVRPLRRVGAVLDGGHRCRFVEPQRLRSRLGVRVPRGRDSLRVPGRGPRGAGHGPRAGAGAGRARWRGGAGRVSRTGAGARAERLSRGGGEARRRPVPDQRSSPGRW